MNEEEKEMIANALFTIGKTICELSQKLHPNSGEVKAILTESEEAKTISAEIEKPQKKTRSFKRPLYVKFEGMPYKKYNMLKDFYEEITKQKCDWNKMPITLSCVPDKVKTLEETVVWLKSQISEFLNSVNFPFKVEKIIRETRSGEKFEA